ncbi:MAG TPA: HAD-IA family hydrolase [Xanthomonadaceae bacterium]|nr:HAD-IA family hydrolase [Xanthomonadaceae bacterium]
MRTPLAITLDLDDTVWPIGPVIARAELALHAWLERHAPETARRWPVDAMRALRESIGRERTDLAHDFTEQRRLVLAHALADSGYDPALSDGAFNAFFAARNAVECYPDAIDALVRLAARVPVAALTNGNADLAAIGLHGHFTFCLGAREHGKPKPSACIFHAACDRLGVAPADVLHVGDDAAHDVGGAARAGLSTCWINRDGRAWPLGDVRPDLEFATLGSLADWLDDEDEQAA